MRRSGLTFAALAGLIAILGITPGAAAVAPPQTLPDPRPWAVTTPDPTGVNETALAALAVAPSPVVVALLGLVDNEPDHEQSLAWLNDRFDVATDVEPIIARIIAPHAATA